uniref:Uncharacterized protein n=1 Tax=Anguilla anguilla TaxID=7936 RepID=A0A0E9S7H3_ANGAN
MQVSHAFITRMGLLKIFYAVNVHGCCCYYAELCNFTALNCKMIFEFEILKAVW